MSSAQRRAQLARRQDSLYLTPVNPFLSNPRLSLAFYVRSVLTGIVLVPLRLAVLVLLLLVTALVANVSQGGKVGEMDTILRFVRCSA